MRIMTIVQLLSLIIAVVIAFTPTAATATDDAISCPGNGVEEVESSAMSILVLCSKHLNATVTSLDEGARVLSLDGAFFYHEIAIEILEDEQFWVTYCRDWPKFESCALDASKHCTSSEVDRLRIEVKTQVLRAWRSIGLFPAPVMEKWACSGSQLSDRLRNVYAYEKSTGCDVGLARKCLVDWHEKLQESGFLETTGGFNETDWLIRRARLTLNCSRMSVKSCANQKVVEFVDFVIKQSIPLEISKQATEWDDIDKNGEMKIETDTSSSTSSTSFLPKAVHSEVLILSCVVQIILLVLRTKLANCSN